MESKNLDYYEFLQISPHADQETIHRVYRFLAARFHPDNPVSGNAEAFAQLRTAYEALSDPDRRAEYDALCLAEPPQKQPFSTSVDFMDSIEGELNRRLAVLAVLYYKRRSCPYNPEVPLAEIETRMGFPREYLDFTTWYLIKKGYVTRADNSDFALTAPGVDFVETQRANIPVLNKLLTNGTEPSAPTNGHTTNGHVTNGHSTNGHVTNGHSTNGHATNGHGTNGHATRQDEFILRAGQKRLIVLPDMSVIEDRRGYNSDRLGNYGGPERRRGSATNGHASAAAELQLADHRLID